MKFSLATNWGEKLLPKVIKLNKEHSGKIFEFFGSLPQSIFGHARQAARVANISQSFFEEEIIKIQREGINFNYLVNSSVSPSLETQEKISEAKRYFRWIEKQNVGIITIGNEKVLDFASKYFPNIPINISVVLGMKKSTEAERLIDKYPNIKRITPHQTINRDRKELLKIIGLCHSRGIEVELLANEICAYDCPKMKEHYIFMSKTSQNKKGVNLKPLHWCRQIDLKNKLAVLNACWIRPEDIRLYEDMGVDILKISGRGESTDYLISTAKSYLEGKYDGNALDLFYQSRYHNKGTLPYYENKKFDGFIEYLWKNDLTKADFSPEKYKNI